MELVKENWTQADGREFVKYLETFKNAEKEDWAKNILNTQMKVLVMKTPDMKAIAKEIAKGNFLSFLDLDLNDYYENTVFNGTLIIKIKDFELMKRYLDNYSKKADNWATCDLLKFNVKGNEERYFLLSKEYVKSEYTFVRRIGMYILFDLINNDKYIDEIYNMLNQFKSETEYYVNMMNAWLLCELFIKRRERTLEFLNKHNLNDFTINKAISKCRDSFRISKEDKEMLLKFKAKKGE